MVITRTERRTQLSCASHFPYAHMEVAIVMGNLLHKNNLLASYAVVYSLDKKQIRSEVLQF
jgi:hypothetical protein